MLSQSPAAPCCGPGCRGKVVPVDVDVEIIAFDVFGTLVDWHTSIAAALAEVGGRAGIDADWAVLASAWRARYRPALARVVAGELPFESLDTLHRMMLDELAADGGPGGRGGLVQPEHSRRQPPARRSSASEHGGGVTEAAGEPGPPARPPLHRPGASATLSNHSPIRPGPVCGTCCHGCSCGLRDRVIPVVTTQGRTIFVTV